MTDSSDTSSQAQPNLATYSSGFTIGGQGPIDLTTIFTPPPSCLSTVTYDGTSFWEGGLVQTGDQNCFPPSFTDIFKSYYSPGICPSGWTSAGSVGQFTQDNGVPGTHIFCCPSGFYHRFTEGGNLEHVCASRFRTPLAKVYSTNTRAEGPIPRNADLITVDPKTVSANTVFADIIGIKFASTDSAILQLMSAATSSSSLSASATPAHQTTAQVSQTRSPTSTPTLAPASTPTSTPMASTSGLSPGAKAGIGVGAGVGAIVLLLFVSFLWYRRQQSQNLSGESEAESQGSRPQPHPKERVELPAKTTLEMPAGDMRPELGSGDARRHGTWTATTDTTSTRSPSENIPQGHR